MGNNASIEQQIAQLTDENKSIRAEITKLNKVGKNNRGRRTKPRTKQDQKAIDDLQATIDKNRKS